MVTAVNPITGKLIKTKGSNDSYRSGWERIFSSSSGGCEEASPSVSATAMIDEAAVPALQDTPVVFGLSAAQQAKVSTWLHEVIHPPILQLQKKDPDLESQIFVDATGREWPYFSSIGGELTYCFTPNSIGYTVIVRHCGGQELDLTDYECW
jgi:hypothetical protein